MGKLGARELNVSSDIDLIYVYEDEGPDRRRRSLFSAHEYFSKVARSLYALIGDSTDDGFVFRVDLALRPNGNSGPPVVSLAVLEEYFQVQGREWERFAWLKSRVVAPRAAVTSGRALALRSLVTPFVYRRYLDYGVFEGLRQLHAKIREEAQRRAAGRPERSNDVKLSRGGIREIEFIVQLLLVVRGGQFPEIRTRSTLRGLATAGRARLDETGCGRRAWPRPTPSCAASSTASSTSTTSRRTCLPGADGDLGWIAQSLGLTCNADACELLDRLGRTRETGGHRVRRAAARWPGRRRSAAMAMAAARPAARARCRSTTRPFSNACPRRWPSARGRGLRNRACNRCATPASSAWRGWCNAPPRASQAGRCSADAALRFIDWMEPLLRRESYLALLVERPEVQQRLLGLLGLARWPMRYLMQHPGVIDELADARLLHGRFDRAAFIAEMNERHAAWHRSGEAGEEALLDTLRRAHHAEVFRTLVRDVEGHITVEQVADDLSALADAVLDCTAALGLGALAPAPSRDAAVRRHRLRQARRQGTRLRQRPGCGLSVRRPRRARRRQGRRGLRRLRAQVDHLADTAHRRRRAVRHRHRAAAQRQLGPAGDLDRCLRAVPARPRQQHGLDLGTPGPDARALLRRHAGAGRTLRGGAPRGAGRTARPRRVARRKSRPCATRCALRGPSRPGCSTSSTAPAA